MTIKIDKKIVAIEFKRKIMDRFDQEIFELPQRNILFEAKDIHHTPMGEKTSEAYYKSIFEKSKDGIVVINEKEIIVDFNRAFIDMLGYTQIELKKSKFKKLTPEIFSQLDNKAYRQLLKRGYFEEYEKELIKKDGTRIPITLNGAMISGKADDPHWKAFVFIRNITEHKQIEEQLLINKRAVDAANDGIIITDSSLPDNPIIYANAAFCSITQYTPRGVIGKNIHILEGESTDPKIKREIRSAIRNGRYFTCEVLNYRKDGTSFWNEMTLGPIYNTAEKLTHYITIHKDITKRKQAEVELIKAKEEAEKSNSVKSLFLENMSHEIRTPLNSILGFIDIIKDNIDHLLSEEEKGFLDILKSSGERLYRTIHGILDISQIEAGTLDFNLKRVRLHNLVEKIVKDFLLEAQSKGLELIYIPKVIDATIIADEPSLISAVSNLVDNAVKYTEQGKIEVSLIKKRKELMLTIKDTGIGIAEDYLDHIFISFSQESTGYTKKYQGLGLGLAIAKRYLEVNNVGIEVQSTKGVGTTITLTFKTITKLLPQETTEIEDKLATEVEKIVTKWKPIVLVVEDDPNSQKLMEFYLKKGYKTCFAVSVSEAKQQLKKHPVNLILLDLSLIGDEDGLDLTRYLRKTKKWRDIPIIASTAHAFTTDRDNCLAAGCNDYLTKPIKREELLEKISEFV